MSRREVGAYGNARGKPDKQRRRRINRENDPRYQAAMAEVRENQATIERLIAQPSEQAALSSAARAKIGLVFEKPAVKLEVATEPRAPKTQGVAMGRFVDCHCEHSKQWHTGPHAPQCEFEDCDCPGYRPITAPDPLAESATPIKGDVGVIIRQGKESARAATVRLALKVEKYLTELIDAIEDEEHEAEMKRQAAAKIREAEERVARLQREMEEAMAELAEVKPSTKSKRRATLKQGVYHCPEPGCEGKPGPFGSAQALGAHRSRKHGYRRGDDDK